MPAPAEDRKGALRRLFPGNRRVRAAAESSQFKHVVFHRLSRNRHARRPLAATMSALVGSLIVKTMRLIAADYDEG
jgi:hypothetical protein